LAEFMPRYGKQAMQKVVTGRGRDYDTLPEG
jgi:hypothetical protein